VRAIASQETPDRLRAADRHYGHAFGAEIPATTCRESFERNLVAEPFDEHDRTHGICCLHSLHLVHGAISPAPRLPTRNLQE
jgi:hypothetical protein